MRPIRAARRLARRAAAAEAGGSPWYQAICDRVSADQPSSSGYAASGRAARYRRTRSPRPRYRLDRLPRSPAGSTATRPRPSGPLAAGASPGLGVPANDRADSSSPYTRAEGATAMLRVVIDEFGQPVGPDVRPCRVTGHRGLERDHRARWLPPRCAGSALPAWRCLLGGVTDLAACAEGSSSRSARYGITPCPGQHLRQVARVIVAALPSAQRHAAASICRRTSAANSAIRVCRSGRVWTCGPPCG